MIMRIGDITELKIHSLAYGGEGIARKDGMVVFVENALRGEEVRVRIKAIRKKFARAETLKILAPSPDRTEPLCPHFGVCGGCVFQHLAYEKQIVEKKNMLEDNLRHLGGFRGIAAEDTVASPKIWNYRNHLTFTAVSHKREFHFGFIAKDNCSLVRIDECPIADTRINLMKPSLRERIGKLSPYEKSRLERIIVRVGTEGGPKYGFDQTGTRGIVPERDFTATIEGASFHFSMEAFFQTNYFILPRMVRILREMLSPDGNGMLLDLYSGVGFFSVLFSRGYREVIAVEEGRNAVHDARINLEANRAENVRLLAGRVEQTLRNIRSKLSSPLHVILDPPRIGAALPVINFLCFAPADKIVYVSCDPAILARDLRQLSRSYRVKRLVPLDMFPHTKHLETLVLLERH